MRDILELNPIVAAIKDDSKIEEVIKSDCEVVFILSGDILTIRKKVGVLKEHNKKVFVHIDMINGISSSAVSVDYAKEELKVDGIITTKSNLVKRALDIELEVVQRFFFIDSISLQNAIDSLKKVKPHAIEIMPGILPKVITKINDIYPEIPIICGGLIDKKEEIINVLSCGAMAVSATSSDIW